MGKDALFKQTEPCPTKQRLPTSPRVATGRRRHRLREFLVVSIEAGEPPKISEKKNTEDRGLF